MNLKKYEKLLPQSGYCVIKDITKVDNNKSGKIKWSGNRESRAYARIVATSDNGLAPLNSLIVYNEFEGQELFKYPDIVDEDDLIILKTSDILLLIKED